MLGLMLMFSESPTQSVECFFSVDLLAMIAGFYAANSIATLRPSLVSISSSRSRLSTSIPQLT